VSRVKSEWIVYAFKRLWRAQSDGNGELDDVDLRNKAEMQCGRLRREGARGEEERSGATRAVYTIGSASGGSRRMRVRCPISSGVSLVQDMIGDEYKVMDRTRGRDLLEPS
jgi:hypothetical protein